MSSGSIARRASFRSIRYANVWEDADVLCEALGPTATGGRLLSIASAGDNTLALLTLDPEEVVAVDLSRAQLACLELRMAAFRCLEAPELLGFLGVTATPDRRATYARLRGALSGASRAYWDANAGTVGGGIIHAGRFERYLRAFRRWLLPLVHSKATIETVRKERSLAEQEAFYERRWDTWRWRLVFRVFFSRPLMARLGRDPQFFAHVQGPVAERLLKRTRHALTRMPAWPNPYLAYILLGTFPAEARPRYLRDENIVLIRERLDRIRLEQCPVEEAASGRFDGFNLSDVFEYMSDADYEGCYQALIERANPGARLAYWNLLVPRGRPSSLKARVRELEAKSRELYARDRAWFYGAFHVDEVRV